MWIADQWKDYEVIDCSKGEKLGAGDSTRWSVLTRRLSGIPRKPSVDGNI